MMGIGEMIFLKEVKITNIPIQNVFGFKELISTRSCCTSFPVTVFVMLYTRYGITFWLSSSSSSSISVVLPVNDAFNIGLTDCVADKIDPLPLHYQIKNTRHPFIYCDYHLWHRYSAYVWTISCSLTHFKIYIYFSYLGSFANTFPDHSSHTTRIG